MTPERKGWLHRHRSSAPLAAATTAGAETPSRGARPHTRLDAKPAPARPRAPRAACRSHVSAPGPSPAAEEARAPACAGALGSVPRHEQGQESGNRALATRRMVDSRNQSLGRVTDTQAAVAFVLEGQVLGTGPSQRRARRDRSGHREPRPGWRAPWRGSLAGAAVSAPFVLGPASRCAWRSRWGDEVQGKAHQRLGCSRTPGAEQQRLEKLGAPTTR